jgi:hypothetical protein
VIVEDRGVLLVNEHPPGAGKPSNDPYIRGAKPLETPVGWHAEGAVTGVDGPA